ncbi:hypothetical protein PULV_a2499 [Pseudoalteromonas ulvae UL12]|uniref:VTT domain-containing protein n=1 Tax=Pseudoalteromonas ulvae TaxID=107327 RepID=A0A2C9ZZD8_PSEDV|nr:YqaA family protein [Pseudoalteromonas ulvae]MBE0364741.1 hypothetical protein [Pseudoalteromonas ulvae UL12]OUL56128.1 hypothetical protein B1199_18595 [Pseudoalteromonas ulvae]
MAYLSLFLTAFVAATILPSASEVLLTGLVTQGYHLWGLFFAATIGNVLGSCVNWWLGREFLRFKDKKWFPLDSETLEKAQTRFKRYGTYSLLLAWVPIIGDPLTIVAGTMKVRFDLFIVLVTIGKACRYAAVIGAVVGLGQLFA